MHVAWIDQNPKGPQDPYQIYFMTIYSENISEFKNDGKRSHLKEMSVYYTTLVTEGHLEMHIWHHQCVRKQMLIRKLSKAKRRLQLRQHTSVFKPKKPWAEKQKMFL